MNETTKTVTVVGLALALALVAWISQPSMAPMQPEDMRGQLLFPDFKDPLDATSMEIFKFDETRAEITPFKVARVDDRWAIPSHDNYPADAKDHLAEAANSVMDLKVLDVVPAGAGDHGLYGVIDPNPKQSSTKLDAGTTGVGTRVTMRDKDDQVLLDLIIGKADEKQPNVRFVRRPGEDPVYSVTLKTDKLSSKFGDWIEKDLLKMNAFDLMGLKVDDYSIDVLARSQIQERGRFSVEYNDAGEKKWKLLEDRVSEDGKWVEGKLAEDEELNTAKLDGLKSALGELKIVDVSRKPEGLSEGLKAGGNLSVDPASQEALQKRGFYLVPVRDGAYQLLSNEGETRVSMKDGVDYVLRFGQIAAGTADEEKKEGEKGKAEEPSGANRYLFVAAEFNPDAIKKPELQPLPEVPAEEPKDAAQDGEKKEPEKKDAEAKKPDAKAERERIEKENQRKQDEYDQKLKKGEEHEAELNARFADWFYVISDSVYQKIHLRRADIIKKKESKDAKAAAGPGAVNPNDALLTPAMLEQLKGAGTAPAEMPQDLPEAPAAEAK